MESPKRLITDWLCQIISCSTKLFVSFVGEMPAPNVALIHCWRSAVFQNRMQLIIINIKKLLILFINNLILMLIK